jgi:hypothetical protein
MEISNFRLVDVLGSNAVNWKFKALVDVTTKKGLFRKRETKEKEVFKAYAGMWYFVESGEYAPGSDVDSLARKLEAEKGKDLQYCLSEL